MQVLKWKLILFATNHKKLLMAIAIVLIATVCAIISITDIINPTYSWQLNELECRLIFDCTPSEFFDKEFEFYAETGDFRKTAFINEKDNTLNFFLKRSQEKAWLKSGWFTLFDEIKDKPYIEVAPDFSTLTLYMTEEVRILVNEDPEMIENILRKIWRKIVFAKMLEGIPQENISICYIEKDPLTGEVLKTITIDAYHDVVLS